MNSTHDAGLSSSSALKGRIAAIDGLRACAAVGVLVYHFTHWGMPAPSGFFHHALWTITGAGWMGVNFFFVLSGFLITGLLLDRSDEPQRFRRFYFRRACRILPAYALALVLLLLLYPGSLSFVALSALFLANFSEWFDIDVYYSVFWSLSVEEHFYLFWPIICFGFSGRKRWIACILLCLTAPLLRAARMHFNWSEGFYTWFWLDSLAWGALLAMFVRSEWKAQWSKVLGYGIIGLAALIALGIPWGLLTRTTLVGTTLGPIVIALSSGLAILFCLVKPQSTLVRGLSTPSFQYFGAISYGLYLYHGFFLNLTGFREQSPTLVGVCWRLLAGFIATWALAHASYVLIEKPALRLKDRWFQPTPSPA